MKAILIEDESLRDGLQSEQRRLSLDEKLLVFAKLRAAGLQRIQVGSFVHPRRVPQMADTDRLVQRVIDTPDVLVTALVLNTRGLERAIRCGLRHVSLSVSASDTHSRNNTGQTTEGALVAACRLIEQAVAHGITVRAGVQCAFGGVEEPITDPERVLEMLRQMAHAGAREVNLADTTGMAEPSQVKQLVTKVRRTVDSMPISLHLHGNRGSAIANMLAGYEAGARIFDTSVGGLGGCPFVQKAVGNIATEECVSLFEAKGIETGIDLEKLCLVTQLYEKLLGRTLQSLCGRKPVHTA